MLAFLTATYFLDEAYLPKALNTSPSILSSEGKKGDEDA
jgi:hypothetical protein